MNDAPDGGPSMAYQLLGEWDGVEPEWPVFGVVHPPTSTLCRMTIDRFGPDFGNVVWQISADYTAEGGRSVAVHTVLRRTAISARSESWVESGLREAKGLVAAELGIVAGRADTALGPWESAALPIDGTVHPAERLFTERGVGWVVELESVVIGLLGVDSARDLIGRIDPAGRGS